MLAGRRHAPALGAGELGVAEHVVTGMPVEHAAAVDPGPEIGRDRHVGTGGDDVLSQHLARPLAAADLGQNVAEALLRAVFPPCRFRTRQRFRHRHDRGIELAPGGGQPWRRTARGRSRPGTRPPTGRALRPGPIHGSGRMRIFSRKHVHLIPGHHARVIVLMAGERQAHALDRIGDEASRLVAVRIGLPGSIR